MYTVVSLSSPISKNSRIRRDGYLIYQLNVLPLPDLINHKALLFFYDFKGKHLPPTFFDEWTLNLNRTELERYNLRDIRDIMCHGQNTSTLVSFLYTNFQNYGMG